MSDSDRLADPGGPGGATRPLRMDARRILRQTSSAMTERGGGPSGPPYPRGRSPSSVFLVPTKNLSRGQDGSRHDFVLCSTELDFSTTCTGFGRVLMNNPGSSGFGAPILGNIPAASQPARHGKQEEGGSQQDGDLGPEVDDRLIAPEEFN